MLPGPRQYSLQELTPRTCYCAGHLATAVPTVTHLILPTAWEVGGGVLPTPSSLLPAGWARNLTGKGKAEVCQGLLEVPFPP